MKELVEDVDMTDEGFDSGRGPSYWESEVVGAVLLLMRDDLCGGWSSRLDILGWIEGTDIEKSMVLGFYVSCVVQDGI